MKKKLIKEKTLGEILIQAREKKHIDLEEASSDISIPFKYLEALEHNKFNDLPGNEYVKVFLKKYCDYLRIDFRECWNIAKKIKDFPQIDSVGKVEKKYFTSWPNIIRRIAILIVIFAILTFLFLKVEQIFSPPKLNIIKPIDGSIVTDKQVVIVGKSEREVELIVNNREIFVDDDGSFETIIDLQRGLNLIKISAKKRYSRTEEREIRLLFKDE